jgi:regulator of chromosome condensation
LEISYFNDNNIKISKVICGSLHTLALTTDGKVYSWGCNDDSALGREGSDSKEPGLVSLESPIDIIATGDSFSIACNSK